MLQARTKASWDRQNYCIPAKSFAAGQIGLAAKLPWTTSNFIKFWPLQSTKIAWSSMHCCVMYQICKKVDFDDLGYWTAGSYASIIANKTDAFAVNSKTQKPLDSNKEIWTASKTLSNRNYLSQSKNKAMVHGLSSV